MVPSLIRVLVTGGAGFLGSHVCEGLREHGFTIRVFDFSPERLKPLEAQGIETESGDCCDPQAVARAVRGVDAVCHLVAAPEYAPGEMHQRVTVGGVKTLVEAMHEAGVKRIIYISSTKATFQYNGHYGNCKAQAEEHLRASGLDYTIFRPALLYGPGEVKLSKMIKVVNRRKIVPIVGNGRYSIWPIYAPDLAEAMAAALKNPDAIGKAYSVAGPTRVDFNSLTDMIAANLGKKRWKLHVPLWTCSMLAWVFSKTTHAPPLSIDQVRAVRAGNTEPDIAPAQRDLGFTPRPFDQGLREHMTALGLMADAAVDEAVAAPSDARKGAV